MTKIKTLKQRLKPEVRAKLESNERKYTTAVRGIYAKLDSTSIVSDLTLEDVRHIHMFSDMTYGEYTGSEIMWCEHLFEKHD